MTVRDTPTLLSTGDVCAVLGLTRDQVRHAVRQGRLEADQQWGHYTWRAYTVEAVAVYAEKAGIVPDWSALEARQI